MTKNINLIFKFSLLIFIMMFCCTGCASFNANKSNSSLQFNSNFTINYNTLTGKTDVSIFTIINNGTIYNIKNFSITFSTYANGSFVNDETIDFNYKIKHSRIFGNGNASYQTLTFSIEGKIDAIEYKSWNCTYANIWETYF